MALVDKRPRRRVTEPIRAAGDEDARHYPSPLRSLLAAEAERSDTAAGLQNAEPPALSPDTCRCRVISPEGNQVRRSSTMAWPSGVCERPWPDEAAAQSRRLVPLVAASTRR